MDVRLQSLPTSESVGLPCSLSLHTQDLAYFDLAEACGIADRLASLPAYATGLGMEEATRDHKLEKRDCRFMNRRSDHEFGRRSSDPPSVSHDGCSTQHALIRNGIPAIQMTFP
ncbi:hypothetical protein DACRYDRAFT_91827 [Dacryopinax primogenitus]|uniref:Uncharacterized protein n=1 Tax=Dacryopinax primogenitus (strain DJM 731) TaxID=1858805 RepID=M5FPP5_DACPD|nr:uncharacterized protein DACRYDRAFT_91827 [Dacryopinax primogenitus]EJT97218.1 hypothetical protein DACRYDRAFT_91827 [Dacryopinax primogenitus]